MSLGLIGCILCGVLIMFGKAAKGDYLSGCLAVIGVVVLLCGLLFAILASL